jgi:hypothetical protein
MMHNETDVTDMVRGEIGACLPDGIYCNHHHAKMRITDNTCEYFWMVNEIALHAYSMGEEAVTERIKAMLRWLLDEGHITPMGVRRLEELLKDEERK